MSIGSGKRAPPPGLEEEEPVLKGGPLLNEPSPHVDVYKTKSTTDELLTKKKTTRTKTPTRPTKVRGRKDKVH